MTGVTLAFIISVLPPISPRTHLVFQDLYGTGDSASAKAAAESARAVEAMDASFKKALLDLSTPDPLLTISPRRA